MDNKELDNLTYYLEEANKIAKENGLGNIFYNEAYAEIIMADKLNHIYNEGQDCDAFDEEGNKVEYKSINLSSKSKGKSFQFHWLSKNKIDKYSENKYFYFAERYGTTIKSIYRINASIILDDLINKAKEKGTYDDSNKTKTGAHKSYSLKAIKNKGAILIYGE